MTRTTLLLSLSLALLAGCMAPPAQRGGSGGAAQACRAQCEREAGMCGDTRSGQSTTGGSAAMGGSAQCSASLQSCLNRCGMNR